MTFADQIRCNKLFQKVIHKVGESEINYIKRFQNTKALAISVGYIYSENQLMHTFLDNFQQGGNYEFRNEEKLVDQKSLYISDLKSII